MICTVMVEQPCSECRELCALNFVQPHIRVQRCFVSINRLKMRGLNLYLIMQSGLATLTCLHMEEGKAPSSIVGSQDALLPTLIGMLVNQTMPVVKIVQL